MTTLTAFYLFTLGTTMAVMFPPRAAAAEDWRVIGLRCEYAVNPSGIDSGHPRLFWRVESSERGQRQTAWQVIVASSVERLARDQGDLWDSGRVSSDQTAFVPYGGNSLVSSQQVFWKVRAWDKNGFPSAWSEPAFWTMGLLSPAEWKGRWIAGHAATESLLLRGEFVVRPNLRRAFVHASGLGHYKLFLNGAGVGNDILTPGWTNYFKTVLYDTHEVTDLLKPGVNAAGFLLGNGFYNLAHRDRFTKLTGSFGPLRAILHLRLEYEDGAVGFVGTNSNWRTQSGPITVGHIFAGEDYDARLMPAGWAEPGFDDSKWRHAVELLRPQGVLRGLSVAGEPLRVIEMHQPIDVKSFSDGTRVYDFGQNASHMPRIRVNGPAGSVIRITPSEVVNPDGTINRNTMDKGNRGNAWWQYTKQSDREETWFPNFYYVGCRYVKAEGFASEADLPVKVPAEDSTFPSVPADAPRSDPDRAARLESIEMAVVHAAAAGTGRFESSNPLLNQIRDLVRWAQRSNMMSVLTDCPHREKLGWLEQYHLNGPAIRYEFDVARIFTKGMNDMADAQTDEGLIPNIAPEFTVFKGAFRAAAEWGASFLLVPWQQYEFNGDRALIETYYPAMKRYFSWLESRSRDDLLDEGLGDWFDLGPAKPGKAQNTPPIVTASAFFYYDAKLLSEAAALLGHADEAKAFAMRADQIKSSYNKKFFDPSRGVYATGSQAANALPLVMGLVDPAQKSRVLDALVRDIEQQGYATTAGDVGFRFVLRALADNNRSDVVYRMVCQREKPGYAYQLKQGATSLTEAWDSNLDTSHNHFMLGQVTEWFYHDLAGIAFDRAAPGFKHAIIRPQLPADLDWVEACHDSVHGPVAVRWERVGRQLTLHVSIPANTTASIHVPSRDGSDVTEGGSPVGRNHAGVRYLRREGDCSVYAVESGSYVFASQWQ